MAALGAVFSADQVEVDAALVDRMVAAVATFADGRRGRGDERRTSSFEAT